MSFHTARPLKTWIVEIPARQEGSILHPASVETLYAADGWTLADVEKFAAANGGSLRDEA